MLRLLQLQWQWWHTDSHHNGGVDAAAAVTVAAASATRLVVFATLPLLLAHALVQTTHTAVERDVATRLRERARRDAAALLQQLRRLQMTSTQDGDDGDDGASQCARACVYVNEQQCRDGDVASSVVRMCVCASALEHAGYSVTRVLDVYCALRTVVLHTTRRSEDDEDVVLLTNVWNCACALVNVTLAASLQRARARDNAIAAQDEHGSDDDDDNNTAATTSTATARAVAQLLCSRRYRLPSCRPRGGDGSWWRWWRLSSCWPQWLHCRRRRPPHVLHVQCVRAPLLRRVDALMHHRSGSGGGVVLRCRALLLFVRFVLQQQQQQRETLSPLVLLAAPYALSGLLTLLLTTRHAHAAAAAAAAMTTQTLYDGGATMAPPQELQCIAHLTHTTTATAQASSSSLLVLRRVGDVVAHVSAGVLLHSACASLLDAWRGACAEALTQRAAAALTVDAFVQLARQDVVDDDAHAQQPSHTQPRHILAALATVAAYRVDDVDASARAWLRRRVCILRGWRCGGWVACGVGAAAHALYDALEQRWRRVVDAHAYAASLSTATASRAAAPRRRHSSSDSDGDSDCDDARATPPRAHYGLCVLLDAHAVQQLPALRRLAAHTRWFVTSTATTAAAAAAEGALLRHAHGICVAAAAAPLPHNNGGAAERTLRAYFAQTADDLAALLPPPPPSATAPRVDSRRRCAGGVPCRCRHALHELRAAGRDAAYVRGCRASRRRRRTTVSLRRGGDGDDAWLLGEAVAHALRAGRVAPLLCTLAAYARRDGLVDGDDGDDAAARVHADVQCIDAAAQHTRELAARLLRRGLDGVVAAAGGDDDDAAAAAATTAVALAAMMRGGRGAAPPPHRDDLARARASWAALDDAWPSGALAYAPPRSREGGYVDAMALLRRLRAVRPLLDGKPWGACASPAAARALGGDDAGVTAAWRVEFVHVWFRYPGAARWALRDVSFRVAPGESLALVGGSGAGKSTVLLLLARVHAATRGVVCVNGRDIACYAPRALRRGIAAVWQLPPSRRFFDGLGVDANVALGGLPDVDADAVTRALRVACVTRAACVADGRAQQQQQRQRRAALRVGEWSGGELDRLALARCLVKSAARSGLVVLDECAGALDAVTEAAVLAGAAAKERDERHAAAQPRRTRIMTSHRLSSARAADSIAVLHDGALVERGTWQTLTRDAARFPHFHALYAAAAAAA